MRKARNWSTGQFWPQSAEDYIKVSSAMGTPENAYLRQVTSYWDMVASFILHGVLNDELFFSPAWATRMMFVFCQGAAFPERNSREDAEPMAFTNLEKAISKSKTGKDAVCHDFEARRGMRSR